MSEPKPVYNHGGARPGAGRPRLAAEPSQRVTIVLTTWHLNQLENVPGDSTAARVRWLIEQYVNTEADHAPGG